ncbi:hypothetical protein HPB47_026780 [Ixodes persulcatus]|uniref:Uncharacterized protein n=1 Tax=Ixodes persulcatus TaxID=34615 RepID=A0AC60PZN3_IXOPE|nr:hypothetical protein HPB47_026780 [Ixodes persulcatus]
MTGAATCRRSRHLEEGASPKSDVSNPVTGRAADNVCEFRAVHQTPPPPPKRNAKKPSARSRSSIPDHGGRASSSVRVVTRRETGRGVKLAGCADTDDDDQDAAAVAIAVGASPIARSQVVPVAVCCCAFHGAATGNDKKAQVLSCVTKEGYRWPEMEPECLDIVGLERVSNQRERHS